VILRIEVENFLKPNQVNVNVNVNVWFSLNQVIRDRN
jgi:hypothetical protein